MSSKGYFDEVAEQWDTMREGFFPESVREKAIAKANVVAETIAADLGAGTGFITEELIKHGISVIAVDQSTSMVEQMRKKFGPTASIDYRQGVAEHLPIANGEVNYAFANMYLHHVENPPVAIQEMVRILSPGGKLVITDLDEHQYEFLMKEQHDHWPGFKREDVKKWLLNAGLFNVDVDCIDEDCCSESQSGTASARISIFIAYGEKKNDK